MQPAVTFTFQRYEIKYLLTAEQKEKLLRRMDGIMIPDAFGRSSIRNIYYDTPDRRLIRNSVDALDFKEKLRVRSYGAVAPDGKVFVELKRKSEGLVYKRRVSMSEAEAMEYMKCGKHKNTTQITNEIDYFLSFYGNLEPAAFISSEREAFYDKNDRDFRMTFDDNILWRDKEMSLQEEAYGEKLLPDGYFLAEIKIANSIPLWLSEFFSENKIFRTSFSKYGNAYKSSVLHNKRSIINA